MCHMSYVTCHKFYVTYHMSHVTCHLKPVTYVNSHRPSLCSLHHYVQLAGLPITPPKKVRKMQKKILLITLYGHCGY